MKTELLAPAGDKEAAYSAFYFGADAIYLGLKHFSARAEAINFDKDDLDEITAYAHHLGKKVYVAINTLMQENELPTLMEQLTICQECKVDAVIVQDLGVARLVKKCFPSLALHASTQMAVHNLAGALALKKQGFERVVLARELSLNEIQNIKEKSGVEIEVFIHGALCYSYSGLCLFSSLTTSRSANRGKCVYSCRSMFERDGEKSHLFSMKDLAVEKDVLKLEGISLKIEGRKKTPLYVGAVTDYYRRILDTGKVDASLTDNLKQIFARPWTKLHFQHKNKDIIDENFVGHRGLLIGEVEFVANKELTFRTKHPIERYDGIQIDIDGVEKPFGFSAEKIFVDKKSVFEAKKGQRVTLKLPDQTPFIKKGCAVYLASSTRVKGAYAYKKPKPKEFINQQEIDVAVFIESSCVTACCLDKTASIQGEFKTAQQPKKVYDSVVSCFSKTGDNPFRLNKMVLENKEELFVPVSILNELRRNLYEQIEFKTTTPKLPDIVNQKTTGGQPFWSIKTDQPDLLKNIDLSKFQQVIVELSDKFAASDFDYIQKDKLVLALPLIIRNQEKWQRIINAYLEKGYIKWMIGNVSGFSLLPAKVDVYLDNTIGMMNSQAVSYAFERKVKGVTLSVEDNKENMEKLISTFDNVSMVVYQDIPLFISANCVRKNDCSVCDRKLKIDELKNGKDKYTMISKECQTVVVKQTPYAISNDIKGLTPSFFRIDICHKPYKTDEVQELIQKITNFEPIRNSFSGNYKKKFA